MQQRAETAEGVLEGERGLHRRELRRAAKELADMQEDLVQVILPQLMQQIKMSCRLMTILVLWQVMHLDVRTCCTFEMHESNAFLLLAYMYILFGYNMGAYNNSNVDQTP